MFEILAESDGGILAIKARGKLAHAAYAAVKPCWSGGSARTAN